MPIKNKLKKLKNNYFYFYYYNDMNMHFIQPQIIKDYQSTDTAIFHLPSSPVDFSTISLYAKIFSDNNTSKFTEIGTAGLIETLQIILNGVTIENITSYNHSVSSQYLLNLTYGTDNSYGRSFLMARNESVPDSASESYQIPLLFGFSRLGLKLDLSSISNSSVGMEIKIRFSQDDVALMDTASSAKYTIQDLRLVYTSCEQFETITINPNKIYEINYPTLRTYIDSNSTNINITLKENAKAVQNITIGLSDISGYTATHKFQSDISKLESGYIQLHNSNHNGQIEILPDVQIGSMTNNPILDAYLITLNADTRLNSSSYRKNNYISEQGPTYDDYSTKYGFIKFRLFNRVKKYIKDPVNPMNITLNSYRSCKSISTNDSIKLSQSAISASNSVVTIDLIQKVIIRNKTINIQQVW